jgi:hypothetical protein
MQPSTTSMPGLYSLVNTKCNRDFTKAQSWGKNIFNNAFPIALTCYMDTHEIAPVYLTLGEKLNVTHSFITPAELFRKNPQDPETYFAFESDFTPYRSLVIGSLPRADVVVLDNNTGQCTSGLEIKLTALPDNSTYNLSENRYGCELVMRPDTIVYLALNIAYEFREKREALHLALAGIPPINDWTDIAQVTSVIPK